MNMLLLIGIPAAGKSSYYKTYFYDSHIRINLDMLKTRHREKLLVRACLEAKQPFVIDNTNLTAELRSVKVALEHNANRTKNTVPDAAILSAHKKLELPRLKEGFDELFYVHHNEGGEFVTEDYRYEI